jgi:hypothetical protein
MNNLTKYLVFIFFFAGTIAEISGQISSSKKSLQSSDKEVEGINKMKLHKAYLCYDEQQKFIVKNLST